MSHLSIAEYIRRIEEESLRVRKQWDAEMRQSRYIDLQKILVSRESHAGPSQRDERLREVRERPADVADTDTAELFSLIKSHLLPNEVSRVEGVRFSQLWLTRFNALATRAPTGERLIFINRACMLSSAYASLALTDIALRTPATESGKFIREDIELYLAALEYLGGVAISRTIDAFERQRKIIAADPDKTGIADTLSIAMVMFIICHELAHHILGHQGSLEPSDMSIDGHPLSYYRYSRVKEYEADRFALELFRRVYAIQSRDEHVGEKFCLSPFCYVAPLLLLAMFESADTLRQGTRVTQAKDTDTHPSGYERRIALESSSWESLEEQHTSFVSSANVFLFLSIPQYFRGFTPAALELVTSPILGIGQETWARYGIKMMGKKKQRYE